MTPSKMPPTKALTTCVWTALQLASCVILVGCTAATSRNQQFLSSYQGFKQESRFDDATTYTGDIGKLANYKKVYIESVKVYPPDAKAQSGFMPELGGIEDSVTRDVTPAELRKLEQAFRKALTKEIGSNFTIARSPGPQTVSVRAAVVDLKPGNPLLFASSYAPYVSSAATASSVATGTSMGAGDATIEAELLDSRTRERFFGVIDRAAGSKFRPLEGLSRWGHVELLFATWSREFRELVQGKTRAVGLEKKANKMSRDVTGTVEGVVDGAAEKAKLLPGAGWFSR